MRSPYAPLWVFIFIIFVYICALPVAPMDIDASQYASISKAMLEQPNFLHVWDRGNPYLDKPPLLFWLSAAAFRLLGVSAAAYKLPSLIVWVLGLAATYGTARLYYNTSVARLAALILATTQAAFLLTNDIRTDTLLTANVALAIFGLAAARAENTPKSRRFAYYILGFSAVAWAMLAKGPIGAIVPAMALGGHWAMRAEWRNFLPWQWILGIFIIGLWLLPMSYGLYTQFDLHPEMLVNGQKNVSGLRFFYWTQSFGRITGESSWENKTDPLFLVHTSLWAFLPWSLLLFAATARRFTQIFTIVKALFLRFYRFIFNKNTLENETEKTSQKNESLAEWLSFFGFVLPLLALSLSRYKLPHYIFVAYPMAAILTADYIDFLVQKYSETPRLRFFQRAQWFIATLLTTAGVVLCAFSFYNVYALIFALFLMFFVQILYFKPHFGDYLKPFLGFNGFQNPVVISAISIIGLNILLNTHLYPALLAYQTPAIAGKYAAEQQFSPLYDVTETGCASLYFAASTTVVPLAPSEIAEKLTKNDKIYLYALENVRHQWLNDTAYTVQTLRQFDGYSVTHLKIGFLNPKKRAEMLEKSYILMITRR